MNIKKKKYIMPRSYCIKHVEMNNTHLNINRICNYHISSQTLPQPSLLSSLYMYVSIISARVHAFIAYTNLIVCLLLHKLSITHWLVCLSIIISIITSSYGRQGRHPCMQTSLSIFSPRYFQLSHSLL